MLKAITRLNRSLWFSLGLMVVFVAAALAADLHTDTGSTLSSDVSVPTEVGIGNNNFEISVWATGNLPADRSGEATVVNKYYMSTAGAITPAPSSEAGTRTPLTFQSNYNYSQCPSTDAPQGCQSNPFVVSATLVVADGTANGTTGTLDVSMTGSQSLDVKEQNMAEAYVKVVVADNYTAGFLRPLNASGSSGTVLNEIRNGRVVPLKLEIFKNSTEQDPSNVAATPSLKVSGVACEGSSAAAPDEEYGAAGSSNDGNAFRWSSDDPGFWVYNLDTKALGLQTGKCYRVDVYIGGTLVTSNSTEWVVLKVAR